MSKFNLKYKKMRLIAGKDEIRVINMDDESFITTLDSMTDETMEECFSSITEMLSCLGVEFEFNDDYFYSNYGRRLIPKMWVEEI